MRFPSQILRGSKIHLWSGHITFLEKGYLKIECLRNIWIFSCHSLNIEVDNTQKMKFSIKDFFSKCDQIRSFLQIWLHLLKKSLMENVSSWAAILSTLFLVLIWL